jgi:hypothetical protein
MGIRPTTSRLGLAATTLACAAAIAPTAQAGTPSIIGNVTSGVPSVTAGANGVFHVVFNDEGSNLITYCQVTKATATPTGVACAKHTLVPFSGINGEAHPEQPWIVRDPASGTLYLAMQHYNIDDPPNVTNHTWVWTSTDDGTTFTGPVAVHERGVGTDPSRPILGPIPGTISFASFNTELFAFSAPIDGSGAHDETNALLGNGGLPSYNFSGGTRIAPFGPKVIAVSDTGDKVYSWETGPNANLSNQASWSAPSIIDDGSDATVSGGADRTILTYNRKSDGRLVAREYQGPGTWGDPVVIAPDEPAVTTYLDDGYQSPGGKQIVGYRENGRGLRVSLSDDGSAWTSKTIAVSDEVFFNLNVARDDNGDGLAVWTRTGAIVAASLSEVKDPSAPRRTVSVTKDKFTTGLNLEGSCVLPGAKTTLTVGGQGTGKITKADFSLGKQKENDAKKPFKATFTVPAKSVAGASLPAKVKLTHVFKKKGKTVTKSRTITTTLDVCGG